MNKKFLSAILFGALMVTSTGTFVSCKDYDDDIDQLWDAVNGQKTELGTKVAAVESSISSLQSAQTALDGKIADAKSAAEKAALEAQKAAIDAAAKDLAAAKAELQAAMDKLNSDNQAVVEAVKEDVKKTDAALAEANGKIVALQAFQGTTEKALEALAQANATLSTTLTSLDEQVKANAEAIGKNKAAIEAQVAALNAYKTSNDAAVAGNVTAIEAAVEQLGKHQEVLNALDAFDVEETKTTIEGLTADTQKLSEDITKINNNLEVLSAAIYKGVTHVSLVAMTNGYEQPALKLLSAEAVRTWVFGDKLPGAINFVKGKRTTFEESFVIRVSPTDAVVSAENITLVNSEGNNLEGLVEVADVQPYKELLTRGISATGLWEVSVKMNANYDADEFVAATVDPKDEKKHISYAVSLNTTLGENVASRNVVSEYDIIFTNDGKELAKTLGFTVDGTDVAKIHNRAKYSEEQTTVETPKEYVWSDKAEAEPIIEGDDANVKEDDDRQDLEKFPILPVTLKKAFTVQLDKTTMESASAFYIVLDKDRAVSSDDSEITAWNAAESSISGINQVYNVAATEGKAEITINNNVKDVYGFRVYAVNHDGSLVDPDGRAFYVVAGDAAEELSAYSVQQTWKAYGNSEISQVEVAEGVFGDWMKQVTSVEYVASEIDTVAYGDDVQKAFTVQYAKEANATTTELTTGVSAADIKFITIATTTDAYYYDDNKTYSRQIAFKNARGQVLKTLTVNFKKVLPTFPATFQAKVNQLNAEGTLNAFMAPNEDGTVGTKDLAQSFNGLREAKDKYDKNFIFTFAAAQVEGKDVKDKVIAYDNGYAFDVDADFIDNKTMHAVTVEYNFGKISSEAKDKDGNITNYTVKGGEFKNIIFSCLAEINKYAWAKGKAPSLTYAQTDGKTLFAHIEAKNARDGKYSVTLDKLTKVDYDNMIQDLQNAEYELWSQVAKDGAIKEGSKNEYFTPEYSNNVTIGTGNAAQSGGGIVFTPNSEAQNPEETVYSTLIIKAKDYFNHDVVITIPNVEVKKR